MRPQVLTKPAILRSPPCTLSTMDDSEATATEGDDHMNNVAGSNSFFRRLLWLMGYHSNEALTVRAATGVYGAICEQVDTSSLHDAVHLQPSFYSRWHAPLLHACKLIQTATRVKGLCVGDESDRGEAGARNMQR
jgi:hypothetical protein